MWNGNRVEKQLHWLLYMISKTFPCAPSLSKSLLCVCLMCNWTPLLSRVKKNTKLEGCWCGSYTRTGDPLPIKIQRCRSALHFLLCGGDNEPLLLPENTATWTRQRKLTEPLHKQTAELGHFTLLLKDYLHHCEKVKFLDMGQSHTCTHRLIFAIP